MSDRSSFSTLVEVATPHLDEISRIAADLAQKGWAEANAGNFSFRLTGIPDFTGFDHPLPRACPGLGNQALIIKKAGARMRDIAQNPVPGLCLLQVSPAGDSYRRLGDDPPSSELPAHLAVHAVLARVRPEQRCLLHCHPTALAALSLRYPEPESLIALLIRAHAEMVPLLGRIQALPFIAPGTEALAEATARAFEQHAGVVWPRHGMIAAGTDLWQALDLIEICEKAANICVLAGAPAAPAAGRGQPAPERGHSLKGWVAPDGIETFYDVKSRDSDLSPEEFSRLPRRPIHVVLDNLRSAFNVGSIFRVADAVRAAEVIPCGYTAHPPHHKLEQAALAATGFVPWRRFEQTADALADLRSQGVQLVALETAAGARPYHEFEFRAPVALILGNEALGVSQSVLRLCDAVIDIPVFGFKNSINVAAAAAVVLNDLVRRYGWL